ncbi:MAG: 50S ribosomal protein L18 [Candidatus Thorarchaeota archaeon]|nr:50S ribosomal protein L18 [Candidatus Thorarchaeota archaeon]
MAQGPTYRVKFRRRREGKTNYYRRRRLLLSKQPRLVIRKTNTKIIVQVMTAKIPGDVTEASAISSELLKHGWGAATNNLPSAYLTGLLAGLRAKSRGVDYAVLDIGLNPPVKGSKIYAAMKGVVDAGIDVPHSPDILPDEDRLSGKHIIASYEYHSDKEGNMFSKVGAKKTNITSIPKTFTAVKQALLDIPKAELKKKRTTKPKKSATKKPAQEKKEKPAQHPPRAIPRKPRPKKLIARRSGKKGRRNK